MFIMNYDAGYKDESIDYLLADLEAEEPKGIDDTGPCHHDAETSEEDLVALLHLLGCTVQRSPVDGLA